MKLTDEYIRKHVDRSMREDVGNGDITTRQTVGGENVQAQITARENGVFVGRPLISEAFCPVLYDNSQQTEISFRWMIEDGDEIEPGDILLKLEGPGDRILTSERVALNYAQQLSGVATQTHKCVDLASEYNVDVYDTRKTIPHHRLLQKYAVKMGGGCNHRMDLSESVMVKDNHKAMVGGVEEALRNIDTEKTTVLEIHDESELDVIGNFDIDV
ncbi:MAG: nicotinate-nucleotide diphosphorylase, partial [bacterium]